jgi:hypothetical protein
MAPRNKVAILFSRKDEKWATRLRTALIQLTRAAEVVLQDELELRRAEGHFRQGMTAVKIAVALVTDDFLRSPLVSKAKMRSLWAEGEADGLRVCPVLVSHCFHEMSPVARFAPVNDVERPLDSLNLLEREAALTKIARRIAERFHAAENEPPPGIAANAPADDGANRAGADSQVTAIGNVIASRKEKVRQFHRIAKVLLWLALALIAAAILSFALERSVGLLALIAGAALCVASVAFAVKVRAAAGRDSAIAAEYVKTGLIDQSVPSRQRSALVEKGELVVAGKL